MAEIEIAKWQTVEICWRFFIAISIFRSLHKAVKLCRNESDLMHHKLLCFKVVPIAWTVHACYVCFFVLFFCFFFRATSNIQSDLPAFFFIFLL